MLDEHGQSVVTVRRTELLEKIKKNREEHRTLFEKALVGYRDMAIAELDRALEDAKKGKRICRHLSLEEPVDHTRDYDRIITMLEMSVGNEVKITEAQFGQYAMDDWSWKNQFTATNSRYIQ
jgi:hypothetical protein